MHHRNIITLATFTLTLGLAGFAGADTINVPGRLTALETERPFPRAVDMAKYLPDRLSRVFLDTVAVGAA